MGEALSKHESEIAMSVDDPGPDDQLRRRWTTTRFPLPLRLRTNIFGRASYREVDRTPVLAPFFALFFALALTDAGYGIAMMAYCSWMMRKKSTPKSAHKFFRLMLYGGAVTTAIGALTGGWFGNVLDFMPPALGFITKAKNAIMLFDPVKSPTLLMIISLALGVKATLDGRHRS